KAQKRVSKTEENKKTDKAQKRVSKAEENKKLEKNQQIQLNKDKSSLSRLNNSFNRPSKIAYRGQSNIIVGVSFHPVELATPVGGGLKVIKLTTRFYNFNVSKALPVGGGLKDT
ncbi:MAG: hypothetical protein ACYTXY_48255, partial [Nostoc sp.]